MFSKISNCGKYIVPYHNIEFSKILYQEPITIPKLIKKLIINRLINQLKRKEIKYCSQKNIQCSFSNIKKRTKYYLTIQLV